MKRGNHITVAAALLGMLVLILDSRCAMESALQGLELCILTVIPSLFPFLFLSNILTSGLWGFDGKILTFAGRLMQLPSGTEPLFLAGVLGGYPAGAAAIGSAYHSGLLNRKLANQLLAFCSNAGPAFLFGMIAPQFPQRWMIWCIWGIHILSAAMVGSIFSIRNSGHNEAIVKTVPPQKTMQLSMRIMGSVCGWILLFRILIGFLDRWILWLFPESIRILVWGLLELSNGCSALTKIQNVHLRFVVAMTMVNFGGVCVAMQTASAVKGLSMKYYCQGKLLQTCFGILLAAAVMKGLGIYIIILGSALLILPKYRKKEVAIQLNS